MRRLSPARLPRVRHEIADGNTPENPCTTWVVHMSAVCNLTAAAEPPPAPGMLKLVTGQSATIVPERS
jgi:hypothetical protein